MALLEIVKVNLRLKTSVFDAAEVTPLIEAAKRELYEVGIQHLEESDPLIVRAIVTYCKAEFGYDNPDRDKFRDSWISQKNFLALNSSYTEEKNGEGR